MAYYCTLPNGKIRYYWEDNPDTKVFLEDEIDGINGVRQWLLDIIPDNESILDIGCGPGHVVEIFEKAERNNEYVGCDNDPRTIELAKSLFPYARFDQEDCFFLSYKNDSFDNAILFTVVEMVADFRKPIEEALRVAKRVIIATFIPLWLDGDRNKHKINMYGDYVVNINEKKFLDFINSFGLKVSSGTLVKNDKVQYWWWVIEKDLIEKYVNEYNQITDFQGVSSAGAEEFRVERELLDRCGYMDSMSVLDYGCGWGSLLTIIPNAKDYLGVDISPLMIKEANNHFPKNEFKLNHIGKLNVQKDVVIAHSVFTHVPKEIVYEALKDVKNCIKAGGFALVDIFYNKRGGIYENYEHEEWLSILNRSGLKGEYIDKRHRSEDLTHYYYKITNNE